MTGTPTDDLLNRLKDPEYAKLYGEENAKVDFAITLTKARKILNLTQKSLADKLGVSQPRIAKLEGGEANPHLGTIGSLLAAMDLKLVTGTAPLKPEPMPFSAGLVLTGAIGAADVGTYVLYKAAEVPSTAVEPMNDLVPRRKADYPSRVAVAGGAV